MADKKIITLVVRFDVNETSQEVDGSAEWLARAIGEYVTGAENPLRYDYGPDADGGYGGAYITSAKVLATCVEPRHPANRPARQSS